MRSILLALALCLATLGAFAPVRAEVAPSGAAFVSPLAPLDTTSPRATLLSLRQLGDDLDRAYAAYLDHPSFRLQRDIRAVLARTDRLFDLSQTAPAARS